MCGLIGRRTSKSGRSEPRAASAKLLMVLQWGSKELTNLVHPGIDLAVHDCFGAQSRGAAAAAISSAGRRAADYNADLAQLRSSPPAALLAT